MEDGRMSDRNWRNYLKSLEREQDEKVTAHYVGAAVLLAAAAGFLALVFALDRIFDFSRFAY